MALWAHEVTWARRVGHPDEYAGSLPSEKASYVNGALVNVDGGSRYFN